MALRLIGVIIAIGFMLLSAVINWRYGASLGRDGGDQLVFSTASLLADLAKAATPFLLLQAIASRSWFPAAAATAFWLVCTSYSLTSIAGFMAVNQAAQTGTLNSRLAAHAALSGELDRKQTERIALGTVTAATITKTQIANLQLDRHWVGSNKCTAPRDSRQRRFCRDLLALETELAKRLAAERLEDELHDLSSRIAVLASAVRIEHGDARLSFVIRYTGWQPATVEAVFVVLFIAVLELGSGLGLFVALGQGLLVGRVQEAPTMTTSVAVRRDQTRADVLSGDVMRSNDNGVGDRTAGNGRLGSVVGDVAGFARARLTAAPGAVITVAALQTDYSMWCEQNMYDALPRTEFSLQFRQLAGAVGFLSCKQDRKSVV